MLDVMEHSSGPPRPQRGPHGWRARSANSCDFERAVNEALEEVRRPDAHGGAH